MWKHIKKNPERLIVYNNRDQQMQDNGKKVKSTDSGDDQHEPSMSYMLQNETRWKRNLW